MKYLVVPTRPTNVTYERTGSSRIHGDSEGVGEYKGDGGHCKECSKT